jgi:hypothetical protein
MVEMKNRILLTLISFMGFSAINTQNPIITDIFTTDPAPLVYNDTLFLYTGHDKK